MTEQLCVQLHVLDGGQAQRRVVCHASTQPLPVITTALGR